MDLDTLTALNAEVAACRLCPRLVSWREEAATRPPTRFSGQRYWARPLPGFGDPAARVLLVGLAQKLIQPQVLMHIGTFSAKIPETRKSRPVHDLGNSHPHFCEVALIDISDKLRV